MKHVLCKTKQAYIQKEEASISRIMAKKTAKHRRKGVGLNGKGIYPI